MTTYPGFTKLRTARTIKGLTIAGRDTAGLPRDLGLEEGRFQAESQKFVEFSPTDEQIGVILNQLKITPHALQDQALHDNHRLILIAGGERGGKSFLSALFGTVRTMFGSVYWIVGPDYELARPEFLYWIQNLQQLGAFRSERDISVPKVGKAQAITKTGQVIETKTADEVTKLAAVAPDGIIMAEAAQHPYDSFLRCVGRTAEKRGWLLMSGTFEGSSGWYPETFEEWQDPNNIHGGIAYSIPSWANTIVYPKGREDPEILRLEQIYSRVEGMFEERLGAIPVPPTTLVFREFRHSTHVVQTVKFLPDLPVYIAVDPSGGGVPYSVVACQFPIDPNKGLHADPIDFCNAFDEIYEVGKIGEDIMDIAMKRPWWKNVKGGAIDQEAPDERKRWLRRTKINLHIAKVPQLSGIRRLKSFLFYKRDPISGVLLIPPHLRIAPQVRSLPYEFRKYKRDPAKDEDHEQKNVPASNQPNHSIKALWYLLIARYGDVKGTLTVKPGRRWRNRNAKPAHPR